MDFSSFEIELKRTLHHLVDLKFTASEDFYNFLGCNPVEGPVSIKARIVAVIAELEPKTLLLSDDRAKRVFDVLNLRFILGLTQEMTADSIHMSVRTLQRVEIEGLQSLANFLWQVNIQEKAKVENIGQAQDWLSQTKMELDSISNIDPNITTDVGQTINEILKLVEGLKSSYGVEVKLGYIQPNLIVVVHPTIFRQILITAIGQLARIVLNGEIIIYVISEEGLVKITFDGSGPVEKSLNSRNISKDIIVPAIASVETRQKGDHFLVLIRIPSIGTHIILVIDDNQDIVYFYRRCIVGKNYKIIDLMPTEDLFEKIEKLSPDIIVLDVMLPNVDGWQILTHLHERPATRSTPVIVCSVVKEEWLALALGGSIFLPKPVKRQQFVDALDQVMHQVSSKRV